MAIMRTYTTCGYPIGPFEYNPEATLRLFATCVFALLTVLYAVFA